MAGSPNLFNHLLSNERVASFEPFARTGPRHLHIASRCPKLDSDERTSFELGSRCFIGGWTTACGRCRWGALVWCGRPYLHFDECREHMDAKHRSGNRVGFGCILSKWPVFGRGRRSGTDLHIDKFRRDLAIKCSIAKHRWVLEVTRLLR